MSKKKNSKENKVTDLINRFIEGLLGGKMSMVEGEWLVEQLQGLAGDAIPHIIKILASPNEKKRISALVLLNELNDSRAVAPLRRMLHKPDYSDDEKLTIIQTLDALGSPIDEATFNRVISDPDALMQGSVKQMLETIQVPSQVETLLEMLEESPAEMFESYLRDMLAPLADQRLLLLLTALLYSEHDVIITAAIDAIERIKEPATIPLLEERAQHDPSHLVRHAAENAALRLQVRVGEPDREQTPSWIVPSALPLTHCLLCTIDGSGGQVLFIVREQPDGSLHALDLMFNDHQGIKECFSTIVNDDELEEMTKSFGSAEFVDISLERARAEVARAYQITLDAGRRLPPIFIAWRGWLKGNDPRQVNEFLLPTLEPSRQEELLAECEELMELDEFEFWFFNPDEIASFVPRYRKLLQKGQANQGLDVFETLLDEAIKAVVDNNYQRILPNRLRRQAWLLAQLYEEEEESLWALAAAAALEQGLIIEHPLLREMMDISFLNAVGQW
ncbi:MAG: HEAT repeat domain-containing protein [Chloroflexi bacterium]|nr:HEAT repeat domain-containing protein [Chloroflexota bacterium]